MQQTAIKLSVKLTKAEVGKARERCAHAMALAADLLDESERLGAEKREIDTELKAQLKDARIAGREAETGETERDVLCDVVPIVDRRLVVYRRRDNGTIGRWAKMADPEAYAQMEIGEAADEMAAALDALSAKERKALQG